jgi:hypothetical protein
MPSERPTIEPGAWALFYTVLAMAFMAAVALVLLAVPI